MSWAGLSEPIEMLLPRNGSGFVCAENVTDAAYSTDCTPLVRGLRAVTQKLLHRLNAGI